MTIKCLYFAVAMGIFYSPDHHITLNENLLLGLGYLSNSQNNV